VRGAGGNAALERPLVRAVTRDDQPLHVRLLNAPP
jgi:hypothetical protein